ncbi:ferredoxin-type protein NapF [Thiohalobacter sp. IOR34]|uniref:ferredoxin-type protein NapF n=1 Tax=Thiohalobacter sp. IOR34 TaxID=3057176 RepID=UPI0025B1886D|nr:ferredoxin-type protein NapF [Thiohalobacter sp. IOR34]WJW75363.1 ferredoxin-type protein NapF [Thiohalobacter sp. IOR34]
MAKAINRFDFLRGDFKARRSPQRPPWALPEAAFVERCTRCGDCLAACSERLLVSGRGGFPEVDFLRAECNFCRACVEACRTGALQPAQPEPWALRARIEAHCLVRQGVVCRTCGELCEAQAIRFRPVVGGSALPQIDDASCTGCGACVAPCPTRAIRVCNPETNPEEAVA